MTGKYLIYAILSCAFIPAYSQQLTLNSVEFKGKNTFQKDKAALDAEKRLSIAVEAHDWSAAAKAGLALATFNCEKSRYSLAIDYHFQSVEYAQRGGDKYTEVEIVLGLGITYNAMSNYPLAMEYYLEALKLSKHVDRPEIAMQINNRIGMLYKYLEEYDRARLYFLLAYKDASEVKAGIVVDLLMNIGNVERALGNYEESIGYYKKYLLLNPTDPYTQLMAYNNIGLVYIKLNELEKASAYFQKAYEADDTIRNPLGRAYSFDAFAVLAQARNDCKQAIEYEIKCLDLAKLYQIKKLEWRGYNLLADCYQKSGDYYLANKFLRKFMDLKDSIFKRQGIDRINVLNAAYKFELKAGREQQQILSLHRENALKNLEVKNLLDNNHINSLLLANLHKEKSLTRLQLNILQQKDSLIRLKLENFSKATIVTNMKLQSLGQQNKVKSLELILQRRSQLIIITSTGLLIFSLVFYYWRHRNKRLLELERIRSNIAADFHDEIGSTLSSIALYSEMALCGNLTDEHKIRNILSQISESSRGTVSAIHDMIWTIQPKNDNMDEVVFRMREYAFPLAEVKNIHLTFHVGEGVKNIQLSLDTRKNLYLVFKEAINNAFKYATASHITIHLTRQSNLLQLKIQDDGVGFCKQNAKAGNGLKNMQRRADQSGGRLILETNPERGTEILFSCPLS